MSKRPVKTAAEIMAELRADPAFRERELQKEQRRLSRAQEYSRMLEPIMNQLQNCGVEGESLEEVVEKFAPLSDDVIQILLSALPQLTAARVQESVVRALGAANDQFDGRALATCFEKTDDEGLRFAVLNTVALTKPFSIEEWLAAIHKTPYGKTLRQLSAAK